MQQALPLGTTKIDLSRFVKFEPASGEERYWRVSGTGRRGGLVGRYAGVISFRHAGAYEVLLQFNEGKIESFSPLSVFPAEPASADAAPADLYTAGL